MRVAERDIHVEGLKFRRTGQVQIKTCRIRWVSLPQQLRIMPIPFTNLGKEVDEIPVGDDLVTSRSGQYSRGQGGHEAHQLGVFPHLRRRVDRAQQAGVLEGLQIEARPVLCVGRQNHKPLGRGLIPQNPQPQIERKIGLLSDELIAGQRRCRRQDVEAECDVIRIGELKLLLQFFLEWLPNNFFQPRICAGREAQPCESVGW